ncbi:hypothetical protein [Hymenobacter sp. GOD-10R]|uniref:hypothetical protein n=1 Tax=Hymenobacter sp. GOD-10R TaxID=3093922 RepID=UPI002D77182D|nr:hypothetical protein [Hymenobacter sp. GOD-10R]WRQ31047.1 hypothetical protein SD425_12335 [Hymenobacter sp. GOD-10R]
MKNLLFLFGCLWLGSCSLDSENTCNATAVVYATQVTGPKTAQVNTSTKFTVYFEAENGCGKFDSFVEASLGDTVKVAPKVSYEGCTCTQTKLPIQADYTFSATKPGTYYLKFLRDATTFIVDTLVVR